MISAERNDETIAVIEHTKALEVIFFVFLVVRSIVPCDCSGGSRIFVVFMLVTMLQRVASRWLSGSEVFFPYFSKGSSNRHS